MPKSKAKTKNIQTTSPHHYVYPNTTTLKNKYGITNFDAFTAKCAHDTAKAIVNLREAPLPEKFDSSYLCSIHHQLFKNTFEWAGQTRNVPFTFLDSSVAVMPKMKRAEWNSVFANDDEIEKGLQTLNKTLAEKNDLRSLTREDFILEAVPLFVSLKNIRPFIDGNEHTIHFFFEKLAQAAGHQLDFSLVTKERMMLASVAVAENGDLKPMQHLFEDISNPQKIHLLKELMNNTKELGRDINDRPVIVTKEGETYTGIYRGANFDSFMLDVNGTYIIGNKEALTPEQLKTLKPGDKFTFTASQTRELKNILIPKETLASLSKTEKAEMISEDACVHTARNQIQRLSKTVYGNEKTLDKKMVAIIKNPALGQQLAEQIEKTPNSVAHLAGFSLCGLQNQARANAKNHLEMLCSAVANFAHAVKHAEKEITQEHATEQKRRAITVEMPSKSLQDLFTLPKELQQESLAKNLGLQKELSNLVKNINSRLSATEHKAVKNNEYETLAQSIGVSENKAKEIAQTVKQAQEVHQQACTRTVNRSNVLAMAS